jgi:hypothetical protein
MFYVPGLLFHLAKIVENTAASIKQCREIAEKDTAY